MATKFFDLFPKIVYDISGQRSGSYDVATNIFVRLGIIDSIKNAAGLYYPYIVQDGDTPEMLADKYYGDCGYHWVILMMNDMVDPFYDWPLDYQKFNNYIANKYGSTQTAQVQIVRYEKQITRRDSLSAVTTTSKMTIDLDAYTALAASTITSYNLSNGSTVVETITKNSYTAWNDELSKNEAKRSIKLLKKEYLEVIRNNFQAAVTGLPDITPSVLTETNQSNKVI